MAKKAVKKTVKKKVAKKVVTKKTVKKVVKQEAPKRNMFATAITAEPAVAPKAVPPRTWADVVPGGIQKMRSKEDWEARKLRDNRL